MLSDDEPMLQAVTLAPLPAALPAALPEIPALAGAESPPPLAAPSWSPTMEGLNDDEHVEDRSGKEFEPLGGQFSIGRLLSAQRGLLRTSAGTS